MATIDDRNDAERDCYGRPLTDSERELLADMLRSMNRLAKWRTVFASWQLGTRSSDDPECRAVKDTAERTLLLRTELTAVTQLLVKKGLLDPGEVFDACRKEAEQLSTDLETTFPGFKAFDDGITVDVAIARETMKGWRP